MSNKIRDTKSEGTKAELRSDMLLDWPRPRSVTLEQLIWFYEWILDAEEAHFQAYCQVAQDMVTRGQFDPQGAEAMVGWLING